jgi:hypothetical protein
MESGGDVKRMRALFYELRLEDQRLVPNFASLWNSAEASALEPPMRYPFWRPLIVITMAIVLTVLTVTMWFRHSPVQQTSKNVPTIVDATGPLGWMPSIATPNGTGPSKTTKSSRRVYRRAPRRQLRVDVADERIREAVAISSWQSPTAKFIQSPASFILMTGPQLNQSVRELQLFLSQEHLKELTQ